MAITQAKVQQIMIIGGVIVVTAMVYGSGMRAQTKKLRDQYEMYKIYRQEARIEQLTIQSREAQIHQLEARRLLVVAENALDRKDTTAAKTAVDTALTRLKTAQKADAATAADFSGVIDDLSHVSLANPAQAKVALVGLAQGMDDKFAQIDSLPAPVSLTTVTIAPPTDNDKPQLGNDISGTANNK